MRAKVIATKECAGAVVELALWLNEPTGTAHLAARRKVGARHVEEAARKVGEEGNVRVNYSTGKRGGSAHARACGPCRNGEGPFIAFARALDEMGFCLDDVRAFRRFVH